MRHSWDFALSNYLTVGSVVIIEDQNKGCPTQLRAGHPVAHTGEGEKELRATTARDDSYCCCESLATLKEPTVVILRTMSTGMFNTLST